MNQRDRGTFLSLAARGRASNETITSYMVRDITRRSRTMPMAKKITHISTFRDRTIGEPYTKKHHHTIRTCPRVVTTVIAVRASPRHDLSQISHDQ